jgi:hypothetical protein
VCAAQFAGLNFDDRREPGLRGGDVVGHGISSLWSAELARVTGKAEYQKRRYRSGTWPMGHAAGFCRREQPAMLSPEIT